MSSRIPAQAGLMLGCLTACAPDEIVGSWNMYELVEPDGTVYPSNRVPKTVDTEDGPVDILVDMRERWTIERPSEGLREYQEEPVEFPDDYDAIGPGYYWYQDQLNISGSSAGGYDVASDYAGLSFNCTLADSGTENAPPSNDRTANGFLNCEEADGSWSRFSYDGVPDPVFY